MKKGRLLLIGTLLLAVMFSVVPGLYAQDEYTSGNYYDASGSIASPKPAPEVPTFTQWGIMGFALLLSVGGICLIRRRKLKT